MGLFAKRKTESTVEFVGGARDGDRFRATNPAPTLRIDSAAMAAGERRSLVYLRRPGQTCEAHLFYDFFGYGGAP